MQNSILCILKIQKLKKSQISAVLSVFWTPVHVCGKLVNINWIPEQRYIPGGHRDARRVGDPGR